MLHMNSSFVQVKNVSTHILINEAYCPDIFLFLKVVFLPSGQIFPISCCGNQWLCDLFHYKHGVINPGSYFPCGIK